MVRVMAVACLCLLSSCSAVRIAGYLHPIRYVYELPADEAGKKCAAQCAHARKKCMFWKCELLRSKCRTLEKGLDSFASIAGALKGHASKKAKREEPSCWQKRELCYARCGGSDLCKAECRAEHFSCDSKVKFNNFGKKLDGGKKADSRVKESTCRYRECDALCQSDYDLCFIGCGGQKVRHGGSTG